MGPPRVFSNIRLVKGLQRSVEEAQNTTTKMSIKVRDASPIILETLSIESGVEEQQLNIPSRLGEIESACKKI
jgi:hypothetical protein